MPLYLVGWGYAPGQATLEALHVVSRADIVFVDTYTMPGSIWLLESVKSHAKGRVVPASRGELESRSSNIVGMAKNATVAVVAAGDPLTATTHAALMAEALYNGVEARYIPGVSGVYTSRSASLLSHYKFGGTVTIPGRWRGVKPLSVPRRIYLNLCAELHTTLLLDIDDKGSQLPIGEALKILLESDIDYSREVGLKPLLAEAPVIAVEAGHGGGHKVFYYTSIAEAAESRFEEGIYTLIVPSRLSPIEEWLLGSLTGIESIRLGSSQVYDKVEDACRRGVFFKKL